MVFGCKKCKKVFRKDIETFEEADEYCPGCDNHYYIKAETPETEGHFRLEVEAHEGHEQDLVRDERVRERRGHLNYLNN